MVYRVSSAKGPSLHEEWPSEMAKPWEIIHLGERSATNFAVKPPDDATPSVLDPRRNLPWSLSSLFASQMGCLCMGTVIKNRPRKKV